MSEPRRILLVEDEPTTQQMLGIVLRALGYDVVTVANGVAAMDVLAGGGIDLVITDRHMPEMDGITLCRAIRASFPDHYLYVMMLSAQIDDSSVVQGLEAGADDFLVKPPDFAELRARLKAGIRIIDLQRQLEQRNRTLASAHQSLEKAYEHIRKDLQAAADSLRRQLPRPAELDGLRFDWLFEPSDMIGGDILDVVHRPDSPVTVFYQIDVAGHGVPAALSSFNLQSLLSGAALRQLAETGGTTGWATQPVAVVEELNRRAQRSDDDDYFTMLYGVIDRRTGEGVLTLAGHPPPLVWRAASRRLETLGDSGFPVGMLPSVNYEELPFTLAAGDRLIVHSDGLSDCVDAEERAFGDGELARCLAEAAALPLADTIAMVGRRFADWCADAHFDDVSLLILEKTAAEAAEGQDDRD
ncbi:sigma-B regulation protein RsbU (phosphoserine phosphatase) [Nitrospirillum amazonense]|uniref:Sigma-B regulation protein RsbU (Phosphoserine phosphatase) n=1 Tax=Nitrospirillum amazonense TaxID=28077 RepID=A0A560K9P9_9PROT|nr:SpoIIE family protein phosphatase [Nitrospirillum amazonense]TWB80045.1 sigma-B regulation protein RsbU (phosphoserine phosphatase) [Nitrospirillum amazonense]